MEMDENTASDLSVPECSTPDVSSPSDSDDKEEQGRPDPNNNPNPPGQPDLNPPGQPDLNPPNHPDLNPSKQPDRPGINVPGGGLEGGSLGSGLGPDPGKQNSSGEHEKDPYFSIDLPPKNLVYSNTITSIYGEIKTVWEVSTEIAFMADVVSMKRLGPPLRPRATLSCYTGRGKKDTRHCFYFGTLRVYSPRASWLLIVWNQVTGPMCILIANVESVVLSWCSLACWRDNVEPDCQALLESLATKYIPRTSSEKAAPRRPRASPQPKLNHTKKSKVVQTKLKKQKKSLILEADDEEVNEQENDDDNADSGEEKKNKKEIMIQRQKHKREVEEAEAAHQRKMKEFRERRQAQHMREEEMARTAHLTKMTLLQADLNAEEKAKVMRAALTRDQPGGHMFPSSAMNGGASSLRGVQGNRGGHAASSYVGHTPDYGLGIIGGGADGCYWPAGGISDVGLEIPAPGPSEVRAAHNFQKSRADAMSRRLNYFIARDQMLAQFIEDSRLHAAQRSSLSALALANPLPTSDFLSGVDY
jgi:hypothetical protein